MTEGRSQKAPEVGFDVRAFDAGSAVVKLGAWEGSEVKDPRSRNEERRRFGRSPSSSDI
jgi:hypothetical protein